jgi:signal transduction histidine kinase
MKVPPLPGFFRGWWFIVVLVVGPAIILAAVGLQALRVERMRLEQDLWQQQSRLVLLVDGAIANALSAIERNPQQADLGSPVDHFVLDSRQLLIFPNDRVFFGEVGLRPEQAPPAALSHQTASLVEQVRAAEARGQEEAALASYRHLRAVEPRLQSWADLNIARIQYRQHDSEMGSAWHAIGLSRVDAVSPSGIPVAMLACSYLSQLPDERRVAFLGLLRETLASLREGRWWLAYQQRALYDEELVRLIGTVGSSEGPSVAPDARLHDLAAIEKAARQLAPRRHDAATRNYGSTEDGAFLLLWSPAGDQPETWNGTAIRAEHLGEWLKPLLDPLVEGLQFGVTLRDDRGQSLWTKAARSAPARRWERLRSVPELELGFSALPQATGIDPRRILWYGFILLPLVMLIVGITAATRVVRKERELGRMQSDFIAAVSHEFKSPLTSIRLLVERIAGRRHSSRESTDDYCHAIDNEAGRLERLVSRLLDWQQIEAGRKHYRLEPGSLTEVAKGAVELLRPQAEAKGVSLEMLTVGEKAVTQFDRAAMTDVLENLIDNAIKYSPAGGRVSVELGAGDAQVTVSVRDEGMGIDPGDLPRIFEKFFRGRRGNQEDVRGTGLGLALVKAAVDAHGGTVDAESTPGKGSRFVITLPIRREEESDGPGSNRR